MTITRNIYLWLKNVTHADPRHNSLHCRYKDTTKLEPSSKKSPEHLNILSLQHQLRITRTLIDINVRCNTTSHEHNLNVRIAQITFNNWAHKNQTQSVGLTALHRHVCSDFTTTGKSIRPTTQPESNNISFRTLVHWENITCIIW